MFENIGPGHGLESSRTVGGCNQGAAVKADTIGRAAVEAGVIGEQQSGREGLAARLWVLLHILDYHSVLGNTVAQNSKKS